MGRQGFPRYKNLLNKEKQTQEVIISQLLFNVNTSFLAKVHILGAGVIVHGGGLFALHAAHLEFDPGLDMVSSAFQE